MPTDEVTRHIHVFLGTWSPFQGPDVCPECNCLGRAHHAIGCEGAGGNCTCGRFWGEAVPMPPLTKADAVSCLEKLDEAGMLWFVASHHDGSHQSKIWLSGKAPVFHDSKLQKTPAEAIFAATDAYIVSLEQGK